MVNLDIPVVSHFSPPHGVGAEDIVNIWARNSGKRMAVRIPPGCLLVQAGKQLEWASGGLIKGMSPTLTKLTIQLDSTKLYATPKHWRFVSPCRLGVNALTS